MSLWLPSLCIGIPLADLLPRPPTDATGGRGRGVPEVRQGAVAGAGRRHLPPHEDVVSALISPVERFPPGIEMQIGSEEAATALSLLFVSLIIGIICKVPEMSGGWSERRRFPLIAFPPRLKLPLPFPSLCVQCAEQTQSGHPHTYTQVPAWNHHRGPRARWNTHGL